MLPLDPLVRISGAAHPASDGATLAMLHEFGRVLSTRYDGADCDVDGVPDPSSDNWSGRVPGFG